MKIKRDIVIAKLDEKLAQAKPDATKLREQVLEEVQRNIDHDLRQAASYNARAKEGRGKLKAIKALTDKAVVEQYGHRNSGYIVVGRGRGVTRWIEVTELEAQLALLRMSDDEYVSVSLSSKLGQLIA